MAKQLPIVGDWYQDAVEDVLFEVVAVDEQAGTIDIQYEDGEVGEYDFDTWLQLVVLPAQPPEDWRVSYELGSDEVEDDVYVPFHGEDPLESLESDSLYGMDDF